MMKYWKDLGDFCLIKTLIYYQVMTALIVTVEFIADCF